MTFDCSGRTEGYYADIQFDCEVFHYCKPNGERFTFVCPPKSRFNQKHMICDYDRYGMKLCHTAEKYFKLNENLYPKTEDEKGANLNSTPRVQPEQQKQKINSSSEEKKSEKPESKIKLTFQPRNRDNKFKKTLIVTEYYNNQDLSTTQAPVIDDASPTVYKWYTPPVLSKDNNKYKDKYKYADYYPDYYIDEDDPEKESTENRNSESEEQEETDEDYNHESENQDKSVTTDKNSSLEKHKDKSQENEEAQSEESESKNDNTQAKQDDNYPQISENTKITKEEPQNSRKSKENAEYDIVPSKGAREPKQNQYQSPENENYQYHYEERENPENANPVKYYKKNIQKTKKPKYEYKNQYNRQNPEEEDTSVYIQDEYKDSQNNREDEVDQQEYGPEKETETDYNNYRKSNDNQNPERYHRIYPDNNRHIQVDYASTDEKQRKPDRNVYSDKPIIEHTTNPTDATRVKSTSFYHRYTKKSEQKPQTILYEKVTASTDSPRQIEYDQLPRQQSYQMNHDDNPQDYIEEQEPENYENENKDAHLPVKIKLYVKNKPEDQQKGYYEEESDQDYHDKDKIQKPQPDDEVYYEDRQEEKIPIREEVLYNQNQRTQPKERYAGYYQQDGMQNHQKDHYQREQIQEPYNRNPNQTPIPIKDESYRERQQPQIYPTRERTIYKQNQRIHPTELSVVSYQREVPTSNKNGLHNTHIVYYNEARGSYGYPVKSQKKRNNERQRYANEEAPNSRSSVKHHTTNAPDISHPPKNYHQNRQRERKFIKTQYSRPRNIPKQIRNDDRSGYRSISDDQQPFVDRFKFVNIPEQSRTLHQEKFKQYNNDDQPQPTSRSAPPNRRNTDNSQQDKVYETTYHDEHREQSNPRYTDTTTAQPKKYKIITRRQKRQVSSGLPLSQQFQHLLNKLYSPLESASRNELRNFRNFISSSVPSTNSEGSSRNPNGFRSNISPYHVYPPSVYSFGNSDIPQNRPYYNRAPIYSEPSYNLPPTHYYRPYELPPISSPNNFHYSIPNGNGSNENPSSLESVEYDGKPSSETNDHSAPPIQTINHSGEQNEDGKRPEETYRAPDSQNFPELHEYPFFNSDFPYVQNENNSNRNPQDIEFPYIRSQADNYQIPDLGVYFDPYGEIGVTPLYDTTISPEGNNEHSSEKEEKNSDSRARPDKQESINNDANKNHEIGSINTEAKYFVTPPPHLQRNRYSTQSVRSYFVTPPPFVREHPRVPPIYGQDFFSPNFRLPFTTTESPLTESTEKYITQQDNSLITPEPTTQIPEVPVTRAPKRPYRRRQKLPKDSSNQQAHSNNQQELVKPSRVPSRPESVPDRSASRFKPEPTDPPIKHQPQHVRHQLTNPPVRRPPPTVRHQSTNSPVRHQPQPPRSSARPKPKPTSPAKPPPTHSTKSEETDDEENPFRGNVPFGTRLRRPSSSVKRRSESNNGDSILLYFL